MARLQRILIAPARSRPMRDVERIAAAPGRGLAGDRYWAGSGTFSRRPGAFPGAREVSIMDAAAVACCNKRLRADAENSLDAADLRRNLVIEGLDLKACMHGEIEIGAVRLAIVSSCPPCGHLSRLLWMDMKHALKGLGGVRARVVCGGRLAVGDRVHAVQDA